MQDQARLLIHCPDQHGLVAAVSNFLFHQDANVTDAQQHATAPEGGTFFMRMAFRIEGLAQRRELFEAAFAKTVGERFDMDWRVAYPARRKRVAVMVSKYDHALQELLFLHRSGDLGADISCVVSNHDHLRALVEPLGIPFHHLPIAKATKPQQEAQAMGLMEGVDLVVLARYMQILSADFVAAFPRRIINIHHSFLPAFVGADPYRHAYERGVKLIGATAHFVTADLDEGPIIEQDVVRVSHRHAVADLKRVGREVERAVLAKAVLASLEDRVLVYGNKTVVFD